MLFENIEKLVYNIAITQPKENHYNETHYSVCPFCNGTKTFKEYEEAPKMGEMLHHTECIWLEAIRVKDEIRSNTSWPLIGKLQKIKEKRKGEQDD